MAILVSVEALNIITENEQNQAATDSNAATAMGAWSNTIIQACDASSQGMTNEVNEQASSTSSTSTNNNLTDAEQIEATMQTLFQSMQKFSSSFETLFSNDVSTDANNEKSTINMNNYLQAAQSTLGSLLSQSY